jgi:hypothetical protein
MPFDPTKPVQDSPLDSAEMRGQLNGLKELIDLGQPKLLPTATLDRPLTAADSGKCFNILSGATIEPVNAPGWWCLFVADQNQLGALTFHHENQIAFNGAALAVDVVVPHPENSLFLLVHTSDSWDGAFYLFQNRVAPPNELILLSPNGHRWQAAIADDGTLSWTDLDV